MVDISRLRKLVWEFKKKERIFSGLTKEEDRKRIARESLSLASKIEDMVAMESVIKDSWPDIPHKLREIIQKKGPIYEWKRGQDKLVSYFEEIFQIAELTDEQFQKEYEKTEDQTRKELLVLAREKKLERERKQDNSELEDEPNIDDDFDKPEYNFADLFIYLDYIHWAKTFNMSSYELGEMIEGLLSDEESILIREKEIGVAVVTSDVPREVVNLLEEVKRLYATKNDAGCIVFCRAVLEHSLADTLPGKREKYEQMKLAGLLEKAKESRVLKKSQLENAYEIKEIAGNLLHVCGEKDEERHEVSLKQAKATFEIIESLYSR